MHFALAGEAAETACEAFTDWQEKDPDFERNERLAYLLGYGNGNGNGGWSRSERDFLELIPDHIDGVLMPFNAPEFNGVPYLCSHNDEAEVTLNARGCTKLWNAISQIVVRGEWYDPAEGGKEVRKQNRRQQRAVA